MSFLAFKGISCSRVQLFALSRPGVHDVGLPRKVPLRTFSESAVYFAFKEGSSKDGSADSGKVHTLYSCSTDRLNAICKSMM